MIVWNITGNVIYFASAYKDGENCKQGIKVRVFIEERTAIPVITEADGVDLSTNAVVQDLQAAIGHLSRMLILAQFSTEQRVRSEGDSGLTNVRGKYDGDAAYDDGTYSNGNVASIHNHADNIIVVGIGEIQAVLNGVEFQTRHNDYNLNMPSTTSTEYGETEPIPYPDVPPEVLNAGSVANQVAEMQEWFRAFKTQNTSHRDYPEYFKPILCYLEGLHSIRISKSGSIICFCAHVFLVERTVYEPNVFVFWYIGTWIVDDDNLDEPFDSDRHHIDAKTWKQLHDKVRWMANSGRKNSAENLAHLPSCIR